MSDFRIAGELPRMHSVPGPSWFPSALSKNAVLHVGPHLFSPSFQRLHPHSFIPGPPPTSCPLLLRLSPPSPCCWLCSPICPRAAHPTLPFPIPLPGSELPICFPLPLCIISPSLSSHPVTVHLCFHTSQPVTADYFYLAGTHSELLSPL